MPVQLSQVPDLFLEAFLHLHEMGISAFIKTKLEEVGRREVSFEPGHSIRLHYFADVISELGEGGADTTVFYDKGFWRKNRLGVTATWVICERLALNEMIDSQITLSKLRSLWISW